MVLAALAGSDFADFAIVSAVTGLVEVDFVVGSVEVVGGFVEVGVVLFDFVSEPKIGSSSSSSNILLAAAAIFALLVLALVDSVFAEVVLVSAGLVEVVFAAGSVTLLGLDSEPKIGSSSSSSNMLLAAAAIFALLALVSGFADFAAGSVVDVVGFVEEDVVLFGFELEPKIGSSSSSNMLLAAEEIVASVVLVMLVGFDFLLSTSRVLLTSSSSKMFFLDAGLVSVIVGCKSAEIRNRVDKRN